MIETLRVQNYKSLKNVEIPLKPLTVLVGPNAAGKSNILDCLAFLGQLATDPGPNDTTRHFQMRGGYRDIAWGGLSGNAVSLAYEWKSLNPGEMPFTYQIEMREAPPGHVPLFVTGERLESFAAGESKQSFERQGTKVTWGGGRTPIEPYESTLHRVREPAVQAAREVTSNWTFYDFVTQSMRGAQPVAKQTRLKPDGSNVATLLHWIFSEERKLFAEVEEHLKAAIPEVDELMSPLTEDGKTYVAWREKNIPGRIPAWNMSEGSVRLVAILLGLLVPQPPPLVAFENPDVHLHAHLMQYLAEILKSGSQHSQIIITTHSPYLLDHIPPENVLIVWKEAGETKVKPIKDSPELKRALKELGLGELYYSGSLGGVP